MQGNFLTVFLLFLLAKIIKLLLLLNSGLHGLSLHQNLYAAIFLVSEKKSQIKVSVNKYHNVFKLNRIIIKILTTV